MDYRDSNIYFLEDALLHLTNLEADFNLINPGPINSALQLQRISRIKNDVLEAYKFEKLS